MMKNFISSYKDLPISVYQFQTKLRNELRAKSGVMRGREFVMKDMYSFAANEASHLAYYEAAKPAYMNVFKRLGIGDDTYVTFAAGGAFTKFSHEFQTICDAGEDVTYIDRASGVAVNEEVLNDETLATLGVKRESLEKFNTAEVGNIFNFGEQKASDLGLTFKNAEGKDVPVWMGSYGIGITRLIGVLVEKFSDEKGLVWPETVAPYMVHLLSLTPDDPAAKAYADALYEDLTKAGVEVLYDDRGNRAGEKLADADLIGIPARVVVGKKTVESGQIESTYRRTGATNLVSREELIAYASGAQKAHHG
jgi:prolyl-tRNA synthetase